MFRKTVACIAALLALCAVPLFAQSNANETLAALLTEVRLLRQALERSAAGPQVQLLAARLTVQNQRVQAAVHDHETARAALQDLTTAIADATQQLQSVTEASERNENTQRKRELEDMVAALKTQLGNLSGREPQLRAREAELSGAVAAEQNQWLLLNQRLDEIERGLPR